MKRHWRRFWCYLAFDVFRRMGTWVLWNTPAGRRWGFVYKSLRRLANWCEDIAYFRRLGWEIYD